MSITKQSEIFIPQYLDMHALLEEHERAHWIPAEADMRDDVQQWRNGTITDGNKAYIKMILRLFTQADTNICGLYVDRLLPLFRHHDARMMMLSFAAREVTHVLGYKRLNDTLGYDSTEFMSEFLQFSQMKDKHEFMIEATPLNNPTNIGLYLAKQILMEGVNLFASFGMLLSFAREGKLPGMVSVNKWSIAEESMHVRGLNFLLQEHIKEHPRIVNNAFKAHVYETYTKVIKMEDDFVDLVYSVGENSAATKEDVKNYIRLVGDYRMQQMGFKAQYNVAPTEFSSFIDSVSGNTFGNFFETTVLEYSKDSMTGEWEY